MAAKFRDALEERKILVNKAAEEVLMWERAKAKAALATRLRQEREVAWSEIWVSADYLIEVFDYYRDDFEAFWGRASRAHPDVDFSRFVFYDDSDLLLRPRSFRSKKMKPRIRLLPLGLYF